MELSIIQIFKDWVIPIGSVGITIWFASSAKKDADKAEKLLEQVNEAIQGWQSKIMNSATNIIDAVPQVIEGKTTLAKINAASSLLEAITLHAQNPSKLSPEEHDRTMVALSAQLSMLLNSLKK